MTMPAPESRSQPGCMMSRAVPLRMVLTWEGVRHGLYDLSNAAIAAACGAAAEVPWKGLKPLFVDKSGATSSAAVMSGFGRTVPPVDEKLPGVIGVPSA